MFCITLKRRNSRFPLHDCILFIIMFACFRGHTVRAVSESFHLSKDAGFKVVSHMMPDLPNVGMERDVEQFIVSTFG